MDPHSDALLPAPQTTDEFLHNVRVLQSQNRTAEALETLNRAIALDPNAAWLYIERGWIFYYQWDNDRATADFQRAVALDPDLEDETTLIPPSTPYDDAIANNPLDATLYCKRGRNYSGETRYDLALVDLNRAIELDPTLVRAYYERSFVHYALNNIKRTVQDLDQAIALAPTFVQAYYYRGSFYYKLGDRARAKADFAKVLTLTTHPEILENAKLALEEEMVFGIPDPDETENSCNSAQDPR